MVAGRPLAGFHCDDDGHSINLKLLNLHTGHITDLTAGDHLNLDPAWSPDGSRLAFVSTRPNGYFNLFVMDIRDAQPGTVTQLTQDNDFGRPRLYFGTHDLHIQPTWSPDGKEIIFLSNRNIPLGSGALWRMPVVANGMAQARRIHKEETLYRTRPHWSPDGTRIVYSSHLGGQFNNLFILPVDGGEPYKLTVGEWDGFHPRWSPDGEWIAYVSNQEGVPQLRLLKSFGGLQKKVVIKSRRWQRSMEYVRVQVKDATTGERMGARIYATASDGKTYVPVDSYHRIGRLGEHFFHTDGTFVLEVPEGELVLQAMGGFEYYPVLRRVEVPGGPLDGRDPQPAADDRPENRRLVQRQQPCPYELRWKSPQHSGKPDLHGQSRTDGCDRRTGGQQDNRNLDYQYFTGRLHPLSDHPPSPLFQPGVPGSLLRPHLPDQFNPAPDFPLHHRLRGDGHRKPLPEQHRYPQTGAQPGALGAYVHPYGGDQDPLEGDLGSAKAFPVDLALGVVDYHELVSRASWASYLVWHHALNTGFRIAGVGGEDSISGLHRTAIVGQVRTYALLGPRLTWNGWIEAIRKGHSFVTNGPLVQLFINDQIPGEEVKLQRPGGRVRVSGSVQSIVPLERAELVINGRRIQLADLGRFWDPASGTRFEFTQELPIEESSWITLQAYGSKPTHPIDDAFPLATTNPVWVTVGDRPVRSVISADYFIRWIDKLIGMAQTHPGWRSQREKDHVLGQFQAAQMVYRRLKEEAQLGDRK